MTLDDALRGVEPRRRLDPVDLLARYAALIFLLILVAAFAMLHQNFLHPLNVLNVLRQVSISGLVALGMTFVILTAGIDLSVGALVALCGLVGAYVLKGGLESRFVAGGAESGGHGVAAAFAVNPIIGAAVFAASKVLGPLWNKVSILRYRITGPIDQPQINEVLRQARSDKKQ